MNFKAHLLIVLILAIGLYFLWMFIKTPTAVVAPVKAPAKPTYTITIAHASLGLNCPQYYRSDNENRLDEAYRKKDPSAQSTVPEKDNVLAIVSKLCSGKAKCDIPVESPLFENIVTSSCAEKHLEVDYRCFSFDRPWRAKAADGILTLNCKDKNIQK